MKAGPREHSAEVQGWGEVAVSEDQPAEPGSHNSLVLLEKRTDDVIQRDRRRAFLPAALVTAVATALFAGVGLDLGPVFAIWLGLVGTGVISAALIGVLGGGSGMLSWRSRPSVTVTDEGIQAAAKGGPSRLIPFDSIALAWLVPPNRVRLYGYDGTTYGLSFRDEGAAVALVEQTRTHQSRRSYELSLDGPTHAVVGGSLLGGTAFLTSLASLLWIGSLGAIPALVPPCIAFLLAIRMLLIRRSIRFGADGLVLKSGDRERFIPYRDIDQVYPSAGDGVVSPLYLRLRDGHWVRVPGLRGRSQTEMLASLMVEGMGMNERGAEDGAQVADLLRRQESTSEWRKRLVGLLRGQYRGTTLNADRLATLMRNPAADPDHRAAAALALLREPGSGPRIRVAAEVSADPRVRAAFEELAAAEGQDLDDAEVDRLIARIS